MKRIVNLLVILCIISVCSCSHLAIAGDKKSQKAAIEMELIKWQIKYYSEQMRSVALEYTGLCFKDNRYIKAKQELDRLSILLNSPKEKEKGK